MFCLASKILKMKAFGKNKSQQQSTPLRQYDNEDVEAGQYLPETQNTYADIDVAAPKAGGGPVDEYRRLVKSYSFWWSMKQTH